ncbi:hypothetical protein [Companilactobacillus mishanensis]|nr:hypothetical protein [Companilactobacillus mishanensis]
MNDLEMELEKVFNQIIRKDNLSHLLISRYFAIVEMINRGETNVHTDR